MLRVTKRVKRRIVGVTALVLAGVVAGNTLLSTTETAMAAKPTLPGVDDIRKNRDVREEGGEPFIILEVVPAKTEAALGFLIGGEEPVNAQAESIKDMPSEEERVLQFANNEQYIENRIAELGIDEAGVQNPNIQPALTFEAYHEPPIVNVAKEIEIRGSFKEVGAGNGDYDDAMIGAKFEAIGPIEEDDGVIEEDSWDQLEDINATGDSIFRKHFSFRADAQGPEKYAVTLKRYNDDVVMPMELDESNLANVYNNQFFITSAVTEENVEELETGDLIFQVLGNGNQEELVFTTIYNADAAFGFDFEKNKYVVAEEADGDNIQNNVTYYYVSAVSPDPYGLPYEEDYVAVDRPTNGYRETGETPEDYVFIGKIFYRENHVEFSYVGEGKGDQRFGADYTQPVYDTAVFSGGFTNEEWFKQFVFDLNTKEEYDALSIDVKTVTMDELDAGMLESADLLYLAGTGTGEDNIYYDQVLTEDMAQGIFNLAKNDKIPTVVNRSIYEDVKNDVLVRKLGAALMHYNLEKVEGQIAVLELADLEATMEKADAENENNGLAYVHDHMYVHDDWNQDAAEDDVDGNNVVFAGFYTDEYTGDQIKRGFEELIEAIEEENFYLEVAGSKTFIKEEATVATAIRHILNSGKRRNVTKTALRVLDLEPYDFEKYYNYDVHSGGDDDYDAGEGNGIKDIFEDLRAEPNAPGVRLATLGPTVTDIATDSICINDNDELDYTGWIIDNIAPQFENQKDQIEVDIMGTKEFIGKIDDLNAEYDLIYLGMDTSLMNTVIEDDYKTDRTVYNDEDMNGLVYTHVGDYVPLDSNGYLIHGDYRLSGNDITSDKLRELKEYIMAGYAVILSDEMLVEGENGWEVNIAKIDKSSYMYELLADTVLAQDEDDNYLYYGKNVNSKANLEAGDNRDPEVFETFSRYLGISKLTLIYDEEKGDLPTAWNSDAENGQDGVYLQADEDGIYRLKYHIQLKNDAAVAADEDTYDCQLFVDVDADGRYEEGEELSGLSIVDDEGNTRVQDEDGYFHLTVDDTYDISRDLPEGYTGFISWKLVFNQNDRTFEDIEDDDNDQATVAAEENTLVRSSIIGYSAVPVTGAKPTINILQIATHNPTDANNLNLDADEMHTLYQQVQDFNLQIDVIPSARYVDLNLAGYDVLYTQGESHSEFLNHYDMVVLGFRDIYYIGNGVGYDNFYGPNGGRLTEAHVEAAILAIREYALSGRSIMFTHDLNSPIIEYVDETAFAEANNPTQALSGFRGWGWYANRLLRDVQGQDRFGWIQDINDDVNDDAIRIPNDAIYQYDSVYDEAVISTYDEDDEEAKEKALENAGLSNPTILNADFKDGNYGYYEFYGENARRSSWNYRTHYNFSNAEDVKGDHGYGSYVGQVNTGQITEYPYDIDEVFEATHSHPQYMQLNMDTNSRDANNNDDIVVWYCLTDNPDWEDSFFRANEMDVRNNFFIYNKGNVTYTGSGDTPCNSDMERKLFVNTLVAAYRSGVRAPRAAFKENEWETSATINTIYEPYDSLMNVDVNPAEVEGAFLDQELEVYFYTSNADLQQSNMMINAKYYIDGTQEDHDLFLEGGYYKEVTPVEGKTFRMVEQDEQLTEIAQEPALLYNNTMYKMSFNYAEIKLGDAGGGVKENYSTNIYVRLGYDDLVNTERPADAEENATGVALASTESISKLHVLCTQLFELR